MFQILISLLTIIIFYSFTKKQIRIMKLDSDDEGKNKKDDPRNFIKKAQKQKEFRTVGQMQEIYTNPSQLYEVVNKYSNTIKKVSNQHPKNKKLNIIDFSLNARGPDEDKIYVKHNFFKNNIRRGNTLIHDTTEKTTYWGRKGLMKFFDIGVSSLQAIVKEDIQSISKRDQYNHYSIFTEIQNALSCNDQLEQVNKAKVHVYRLNKANGQNAQISYFKPTDQWVISSKNVSILVKSAEEMKHYDGDRYQFSKLIASTWFNILKDKKKAEIDLLKADLNGKTLVGQYCGNPQFQHLVKYTDVTIYFYAVVENQSIYTCIPPNDAFILLEKHNIPIVKNHQKSFFGTFSNYVELGKAMINLFSEVARSSIFEDQEGSVIYFVIEKPKIFCEFISDRYLQKTVPIPDKWEQKETWLNVSSLGKLKTLQYRILRKLRQKLRGFTRIKHGNNANDNEQKKQLDTKKFQQKYGSFQKQCYELLRKEKLNKSIEYFFCIALLSFEYIFKNRKSSKNVELMNDHFIDFLSVIFWCVQNKKQITPAVMNDHKLIEQLRGQNWDQYNQDIVKDYQVLLNKIAPKFAFIKKKLRIGEVFNDQEDENENNQAEDEG